MLRRPAIRASLRSGCNDPKRAHRERTRFDFRRGWPAPANVRSRPDYRVGYSLSEADRFDKPPRGLGFDPFDRAVGVEDIDAFIVVVLRRLDCHHPLGVNPAGEAFAGMEIGTVSV